MTGTLLADATWAESAALWIALLCNLFGLIGVTWFIANYARLKFENTKLGLVLMLQPISLLFLAFSAIVRRLSLLLDAPWLETGLSALVVGIAWAWVGGLYFWQTDYLRDVQLEELSKR